MDYSFDKPSHLKNSLLGSSDPSGLFLKIRPWWLLLLYDDLTSRRKSEKNWWANSEILSWTNKRTNKQHQIQTKIPLVLISNNKASVSNMKLDCTKLSTQIYHTLDN